MELDNLKETIQEFFQENTVTIVGSGLSAAEGIPGMSALANYLIAEIPKQIQDQSDIDVWSGISTELALGKGLESALLEKAPPDGLEVAIRDLTACYIGAAEKEIIKSANKKSREN